MSNQKYVNKIRNVKCDICNKDLITGNKLEAVQNGLMSDELILSQAAYHIRKHYREEIPADINKFMIIEENKKVEEEPAKLPHQQQVKPKNNGSSSRKVKQPTKEKEEPIRCKLCGGISVAFDFEESRREHLENYHRFSETIALESLPTEWFFEQIKETSA